MSRECTIVSLVPTLIEEYKPGIYPGFFQIQPCKNDIPQLLYVGESVYHVEIDEDRTITVKCSPEDIAQSLIYDYISSCLAYSEEDDAIPGIFWKSGKIELGELLTKYDKDLINAKASQVKWFNKLVAMADDDWERTRQHKTISDIQRYAAKYLNLERPWIILSKTEGLIKCPACKTLIVSDAIVCATCKCIINLKAWESMKFAEVR